MQLGCPVVVSDIRQHREILEERSAVFCAADNPADIAAAIERSLGDAAGTQARASAARQQAAGYSIDAACSAYIELYATILRKSERTG
jgi:glycosyltransferase involved in cell wall biosynthesis